MILMFWQEEGRRLYEVLLLSTNTV